MSFLLNNPPKLSDATPTPSVPVEYVLAQEVEIDDPSDPLGGSQSSLKSDVPRGARMATVNLVRNASGAAYFLVYLNEQAVVNFDAFIYNVIDSSSSPYSFSFAIPDGVSSLFFNYGGGRHTDVFKVAYS